MYNNIIKYIVIHFNYTCEILKKKKNAFIIKLNLNCSILEHRINFTFNIIKVTCYCITDLHKLSHKCIKYKF